MYTLSHLGHFTNIKENNYKVEIFKKTGTPGAARRIALAGTPVVQSWEEDNPLAPVRGSKLVVNIVNHNNSLPLTSFYSPNDDEYKIVLTDRTYSVKLFEGYLVQDDCSEEMVDYNHVVSLVATDNLGLLKEIRLDEALTYPVVSASVTHEIEPLGGNDIRIVPATYEIYETIAIYDLTGISLVGVYRIEGKNGNIYTLDNPFSLPQGIYIVVRNVIYPANTNITLFALVQACLQRTGIRLPLRIYCNIKEITQSFNFTFLQQTFIKRETFLNGDDYETCWTVLEQILKPLRISLYQAGGNWILRKWDELHYLNPWRYYQFNEDYFFVASVEPTIAPFISGIGMPTVAKNGLIRRIERPFEYVKEKFNYKQADFIRNANLQEEGSLIRSYTSLINGQLHTVSEYEMKHWFNNSVGSSNEFFIRVVVDSLGNEVQRYSVVKRDGISVDNDYAILSTPIEVNKNDRIKGSYQFKVNILNFKNVATTHSIGIILDTDGTFATNGIGQGTYMLLPGTPYESPIGGSWKRILGPPLPYTIALPQLYDKAVLDTWQTSSVESQQIPMDGFLYVVLHDLGDSWINGTNGEAHYKDISLDVSFYINESTKIKGHEHTSKQPVSIKNNSEVEIHLDDSPRNSIAGTLLLGFKTNNGLTVKTTKWSQFDGAPLLLKLGEMATIGKLARQSQPLTIMEGSFFGLVQDGVHFSIDSVMHYNFFPNLKFICGRLEIDYQRNEFTGTMYQGKDDYHDFLTFAQTYTFKYIYAQK